MKQVESKYKSLPFWSWNDKLDKDELVKQVEWMHEKGIGGFFMHARGGLKTEYLGKEWFECIDACCERAKELGMEAYAYDENGWPSGFAGGKLLEDIENHDRYLTHTFGKYDKNALASYDMSKDCLVRANEECESCLNVYEHYSVSTADILNPQVVDKFIEETHEKYRAHDTYSLKGFFTDEPQYYRWDTPYTKVLPEYFKKTYNEDILDGLGHLFVEKEGYRSFRYKYWKAMQTLMLENFGKKIYDWCDKYGYKLTGHYIEEGCLCGQMECCAGIMPFYEYEHIPGIDHLGGWIPSEVSPKQASSVACQLGKDQVITETFACCGWNISPRQIKTLAEAQYVSGINLMCQHLLPYKEHGQRKRDYPAHYSHANPWVRKGFLEFNDYFSLLGKILSTSEEIVNVGLLHPIRSAYFDYKRFSNESHHGLGSLESAFEGSTYTLANLGISHHYIDETILEKHGSVKGSSLIVGKCKYDYLIIPKIYTMDKSTEAILSEYIKNGGKVLLLDGVPEYLEGEKYSYDYLKTNTSLEEIINSQGYRMEQNPYVRVSHRRDKEGNEFIYAVNCSHNEATVDFDVKGYTSFKSYDILDDCYRVIPTKLHFEENQSYILYFSNEKPEEVSELSVLELNREYKVKSSIDNYFTLDFIRYSTDGVNYSEPLHHMGVFNEMLEKRYRGKLYLKYEFNVSAIPESCTLLTEDMNTLDILINGEKAVKIGCSEFENTVYEYDIAKHIIMGLNEIVMTIDYYQGENVYYALFGENVTETLKNCLAYDTDIEAVYLKGNFGVYGDFKEGKKERVWLGNNFYIGEQKNTVSSLVKDGFPFFSGHITLTQTVTVDSTAKRLVIKDNFQLVDVKVNGNYIGRLMMKNSLDLSEFLRVGDNEIELTVTVSNRNLLGPFHTKDQESLWVSPESYERLGTWKNGHSPELFEDYALVESII